MRNTSLLAALFFCAVYWTALPASAASLGAADGQIAKALASETAGGVISGLREAEKELVAANAAQKSATPSAAVSGRAHLIEGLLKAADLEGAGDAIEAQRFYARSLSLAKSLSAVGDTATGQPSSELTRAAKAVYGRMAQLGNPFRSQRIAYTLRAGEELLHRRFVADGPTLKAYELAGNPAVPDAQWRQTAIGSASPALVDALKKNLALSGGGASAKAGAGRLPQFVLLVGGALGRASLAVEKDLAGVAAIAAQRSGIAVAVVADPARKRPFRMLPGIAGDVAEDSARLIHTPTGSDVAQWRKVVSAADVETVAEAAWALRDAILRDLNLGTEPDVDLAKLTVKDAPLDPPPAEPVAVKAALNAVPVASDKALEISPRMALRPVSQGGDGWSQFALDDGADVWIRASDVGAYIEYPPDGDGVSLFGLSGEDAVDAAPRVVTAKGAALHARPDSASRKLMLLPGKAKVSLVWQAAATGDGGDETAAAAPAWAFVRFGDSAGWVEAARLANAPPAAAPPVPKAETVTPQKPRAP